MNWKQARQLLSLARAPRTAEGVFGGADKDRPRTRARCPAASLSIVSGKGGTGKSVVSASLAALFARHDRSLLIDADFGVGNAHLMQGATPEHSFADVVAQRLGMREILTPCAEGLDLLAAGSGYARLTELTTSDLELIALGLELLETDYRFTLVDSAAGIPPQTITFAAATDLVLIVTTPDITAMTDAYAFYKVLLQKRARVRPLLLVNRASSAEEAASVVERIQTVSRKYLGSSPTCVGFLPDDRAAFRCVQARTPVVDAEPQSELSQALTRIGTRLEDELRRQKPRGLGRGLLREEGAGDLLGKR